ncbi:MAG: hypothetical protein AMXMBFR64_06910 [Myxococcales bacterium]
MTNGRGLVVVLLVQVLWSCEGDPAEQDGGGAILDGASGSQDAGPGADGGQDAGAVGADSGAVVGGDAGGAGGDSSPTVSPLLDLYELGGDAWPESVAFDPVTRAFFTGSLTRGNVTRTDGVTGALSELHPGNGDGWLTLGLEVDAARRRLWVCTVKGKSIERGEVLLLDVDSGALTARVDLEEAAPGAACTDFALRSDGVAFVTDRQAGRIYEIAAGAQPVLKVLVSDPLLDPEAIGQNGIVLSPDEKTLISGKYLPPRLIRVSLDTPAPVVTALDLDFGDLAGGADDLVIFDGRIHVVVEDTVAEVVMNADWTAGSVTAAIPVHPNGDGSLQGGYSGLTVAEGAVYASRSDVLKFAVGAVNVEPFVIRRLSIPPL